MRNTREGARWAEPSGLGTGLPQTHPAQNSRVLSCEWSAGPGEIDDKPRYSLPDGTLEILLSALPQRVQRVGRSRRNGIFAESGGYERRHVGSCQYDVGRGSRAQIRLSCLGALMRIRLTLHAPQLRLCTSVSSGRMRTVEWSVPELLPAAPSRPGDCPWLCRPNRPSGAHAQAPNTVWTWPVFHHSFNLVAHAACKLPADRVGSMPIGLQCF